jgi:hypothetical protein
VTAAAEADEALSPSRSMASSNIARDESERAGPCNSVTRTRVTQSISNIYSHAKRGTIASKLLSGQENC